MSDALRVEIQGIEELQRKLKDPSRIKHPLYILFRDATNIGKEAARVGIEGGTGIAVRSIAARIEPMDAFVYTNIPKERALNIEEGRPPGQPPSMVAIAKWLQGQPSVRHLDQLSREDVAEIRLVQEAIRLKGAKGKRYLQAAADRMREAMPRLMRELGERVKGEFKRS